MELILAFFVWIGFLAPEPPLPPPPPPPPPPAPVARAAEPAPVPQLLPEPPPPSPLPPARGCRDALAGGEDPDNLPGQIDGKIVYGVSGLERLRSLSGDALLVIRGGNFSGAPFNGRRLRNFCFIGTNFIDSDWREAETSGVGFIQSDFTGAWLDRSRMRDLLLDTVNLDGATALGADWRGGRLQGGRMGSLKRVRLDGADLRGFRVDCGGVAGDSTCLSSWGEISLRGADLRGAHVDTLRAEVDWTGATLGGTRVSLRQLPDIGPARHLGPLIVRAGDVEASLSPAEYRSLQPFVRSSLDSLPRPGAGDPPSRLRPGSTSLFVETSVQFGRPFRSTPLFMRLVPVLASKPISRVLVTVRRDGRIDVEGDAVGGGDHICGLDAKGLRLDRATGWYSGPHTPWEGDPPEWRGRPMPVLRMSGDWAEAYIHGHSDRRDPRLNHYITCGARAGFGDMIRLPLTSAEARRWSKVMPR